MSCSKILSLAGLLALLLAVGGCGTTSQPSPQTEGMAAPAAEVEAAPAEATPLDALIDKAVAEARAIKRTATVSGEGRVIEVTPMWGPNYQGEVHIRIFDPEGNLIRDEYRP